MADQSNGVYNPYDYEYTEEEIEKLETETDLSDYIQLPKTNAAYIVETTETKVISNDLLGIRVKIDMHPTYRNKEGIIISQPMIAGDSCKVVVRIDNRINHFNIVDLIILDD